VGDPPGAVGQSADLHDDVDGGGDLFADGRSGRSIPAISTRVSSSAMASPGELACTVDRDPSWPAATTAAGPPVSGDASPVEDTTTTSAPTTVASPAASVAAASASPGFGSTGMSPAQSVTVTVARGVIDALTMTGPDGAPMAGTIAPDHQTWTLGQNLAFGAAYTVTGTATGTDGRQVPISGTFSTARTPPSATRCTPVTAPWLMAPDRVTVPRGTAAGAGAITTPLLRSPPPSRARGAWSRPAGTWLPPRAHPPPLLGSARLTTGGPSPRVGGPAPGGHPNRRPSP
jgi:Bacterial Ig domain